MTDRAADRTLADFIAGALSPPLIMAMVGSLVFFLVEILYDGFYRGSLQWVLFFFVFGAVLVSRIAMQGQLASRAAPYGLVLGTLVWIALRQFVDYSENPTLAGRSGLVNLGLIVIIWWSAHRLTRDCTYLDDESSNGGVGLLDEAGLDLAKPEKPKPEAGKKSKKKKPEEQAGLPGWWERFRQYQARKKEKPHTLGVWVVIFSLAALPLFGLGQAQIPVEDVARRRYAFFLLVVYVGAGLGLLLTTSFLGLRSYLRERKVTMPLGITLGWLLLGAVLIGAHLFVSSLLPRPADPQPLWDWTGLTGASERDPSKWSPFEANEPRKKKEGGERKKGRKGDGEKGRKGEKDRAKSDKGDAKDGDGDKKDSSSSEQKGKDDSSQDGNEKQDQDQSRDTESASSPVLGGALEFFLKLARWLVIALAVIIFIFVVGTGLLRFLANFTLWAQKLLAMFQNLQFGFETGSDEDKDSKKAPTPRPFSSFVDPFLGGAAEHMSPAELVRYSFAALQAWGREHDLPRGSGETALEFARRIGEQAPELGEEAVRLAGFYARLAYSTDTLTGENVEELRGFWLELAHGVEKVV